VIDPAAVEIAERAGGCRSWDDLAERARGCVAGPDLVAARSTVVIGDLPAGARLLLVGEAPGAREDEVGRPFVGKAGKLLDDVLAEAGIARADVAVANVVKCRPPGNRMPTRAEARRCRGWLDRQMQLADPELVVTLGGTALAWAFGYGTRLADMRGRVHDWRERRLLPTYHPSAAIRFGPAGAPLAALRADLKLAGEVLCAR
jgi:uracil-DNA glycosylase family 4